MKINGVKVVGKSFAYDGCHKIYVLENELEEHEAIELEYEIYPIDHIERKYMNSCGLEFINNWSLTKTYVGQFESATFEE